MTVLFRHVDVDGDRLAVFDANIPGQGLGINIRTDPNGSSLPIAEIPVLIAALRDYISASGGVTKECPVCYRPHEEAGDVCADCSNSEERLLANWAGHGFTRLNDESSDA